MQFSMVNQLFDEQIYLLCSISLGFIDMPELIEHTQHNYAQWKTMEEQGIHTLNDIAANAQNFISYQKPILPNNIEE